MPELDRHGRRIWFTDIGAGEPVVLLHAASSSSAQWRPIEPMLTGAGFRVVAPDLQGYGRSSEWDPSRPLRFEDELGPLRAVLAGLGDGPVHLVGHSYGALIALQLALTAPSGTLISLTLIEPIAFYLLREAGEHALFATVEAVATAFAAAFDGGDHQAAAAGFVDYWSGAGTWRFMPPATRDYAVATAGKVRCEWSLALGETDNGGATVAGHKRLPVPVLLVHGEQTKAPARRVAELLRASLEHAELVSIAGAGHMSPLTHPAAVSDAILAALRAANPLRRHRALLA